MAWKQFESEFSSGNFNRTEMNSNNSEKFISVNGLELKDGHTYWYATVIYCCHFSQTKVKSFKFDSSDDGHLKFVKEEVVYETEFEALDKANEIRKIFGFKAL